MRSLIGKKLPLVAIKIFWALVNGLVGAMIMRKSSWLFWSNLVIFQWAGVRLAKIIDEDSGEQLGWT